MSSFLDLLRSLVDKIFNSHSPTPEPPTSSSSEPLNSGSYRTWPSSSTPSSSRTSLPSFNGGPSPSIYQPSNSLKPAISSSEPPQSSSKPTPKPQTTSSSKPSSTQSFPASPSSSRTSLPPFNEGPYPSIYQPSNSLKPATSSSEPPQSSSKPTPKPQTTSSSKPSSTQSFPASPSSSRTSLPSFNGGPSPSSPKLPSPQKPPSVFKPIIREASPNGTDQKGKANYIWVDNGSLPLYMIPEDMKDLIKKDIVPDVLKKPLSPLTYKDYFAALLYAEEYYYEKWSNFEMKNVTLELQKATISKRHNKHKHVNQSNEEDDKIFIQLEIDSIPENRPFLLSRDLVYARPSGSSVDPFQGVIFRLLNRSFVLVEFEDDFYLQHYSSRKYDISFSFNRVCLKRAHQALNAVSDNLLENFLFPDSKGVPTDTAFDTALSSHSVKYHSVTPSPVSQILRTQGSPPYLLAGPLCVSGRKAYSHLNQPSETGKVVGEAIVKIYNSSPGSRILISAPSNNACDLLMRCLKKDIPESHMFRANAAFREKEDVPDDILSSCLYKEECFVCPSLHDLKKFRVIFSTFMSSFRLQNEGIAAGHFSHIFLVDASSAIEPEALVTLANFSDKNTAVIVTGEPGNSSKWVRSEIGRKKGLTISYFERLCECRTYRTLNPKFITNLG